MSPQALRRWFAFTTLAGQERRAQEFLAQTAAETRLPTHMVELKRWRDGPSREREIPLLAGYVFGGFDAAEQLDQLLSGLARARHDGRRLPLRKLVANAAGRPLELRADREGRPWEQRMDYSTVKLPGDKPRPLGWSVGVEVRITNGPFAGFTGPVERISGEQARVLVNFFGRSTPVNLHVTQAVRSSPVPVDAGREAAERAKR